MLRFSTYQRSLLHPEIRYNTPIGTRLSAVRSLGYSTACNIQIFLSGFSKPPATNLLDNAIESPTFDWCASAVRSLMGETTFAFNRTRACWQSDRPNACTPLYWAFDSWHFTQLIEFGKVHDCLTVSRNVRMVWEKYALFCCRGLLVTYFVRSLGYGCFNYTEWSTTPWHMDVLLRRVYLNPNRKLRSVGGTLFRPHETSNPDETQLINILKGTSSGTHHHGAFNDWHEQVR